MEFHWPTAINLVIEIAVVAVTAGWAVWKSVKSGLDTKINGMEGRITSELNNAEGRLGTKVDSVDTDLRRVEGQVGSLVEEVRTNSERIAVLRDRWDRRNGLTTE